jgi:hypothetical protein
VQGTEAGPLGAEADKHCWQLPKNSGYVWEWIFHVDFDYWIGRVAKTHEAAFQVAFARLDGVTPPGLVEPETAFVKSGNVGGTTVKWYKASEPKDPNRLEYGPSL